MKIKCLLCDISLANREVLYDHLKCHFISLFDVKQVEKDILKLKTYNRISFMRKIKQIRSMLNDILNMMSNCEFQKEKLCNPESLQNCLKCELQGCLQYTHIRFLLRLIWGFLTDLYLDYIYKKGEFEEKTKKEVIDFGKIRRNI